MKYRLGVMIPALLLALASGGASAQMRPSPEASSAPAPNGSGLVAPPGAAPAPPGGSRLSGPAPPVTPAPVRRPAPPADARAGTPAGSGSYRNLPSNSRLDASSARVDRQVKRGICIGC